MSDQQLLDRVLAHQVEEMLIHRIEEPSERRYHQHDPGVAWYALIPASSGALGVIGKNDRLDSGFSSLVVACVGDSGSFRTLFVMLFVIDVTVKERTI